MCVSCLCPDFSMYVDISTYALYMYIEFCSRKLENRVPFYEYLFVLIFFQQHHTINSAFCNIAM